MTDDEARVALAYLLLNPLWTEQEGWGAADGYTVSLEMDGYLEHYIDDANLYQYRLTPAGLEFLKG